MKHYFVLLITIFLICLFSCNPSGGEENGSFLLSYEDASCIEGWIKIDAGAVALPADISLLRDGTHWRSIKLTEKVSEVMLDTLTPNTTYNLRGEIKQGSIYYKTNDLTFKTLDTTSHNFTWQTWTFGEAGSSTLNDVAIINENDIWAVGEIYKQGDPILYNAVHWDGSKWELKRITVYYNGRYISAPFYSVFAFGKNDIWFSSGIPVHGDGNTWQQYHLFDMGVLGNNDGYLTKIWGSSSNDIYFVGVNGSIAHYNGTSWKKIESGTTLDLFDINSIDGKNIYISGGNFGELEGVVLQGNSIGFKVIKEGRSIEPEEIFNPYFAGVSKTIWVSNNGTIRFGGNLLYRYKFGKLGLERTLPGNDFKINSHGEYWGFISLIRGHFDNDIIMAGEGNTLRHYNGKTWAQLGMPYNYNSDYTWLSVAIKNNLIVTVGRSTSKGIIMRLNR